MARGLAATCLAGIVAAGAPGASSAGEGAGNGSSVTAGPEAAVHGNSPFGEQVLLEQARAWQGAWVTSGSPHYKSVAWKVEGDSVIVYDGAEEERMAFTVMAPCMAKLEGEKVTRYRTFAFRGERKLASGGTGAGVLTDEGFVACLACDVYVGTGSGCRVWTTQGFDRGFEQAECRESGNRVEVKTPDLDNWNALRKTDGLLVSRLLRRRNRLKSYPTFDQAKAAVDQQNDGS